MHILDADQCYLEWFLAWQCILGLCTYSSSTHKYKGRVKHTHPTFPPGQMCLGCIYGVELAHKQTHKCGFPFNPEKVKTSKCVDVKTAESLKIRCSMNVKQLALRDAAWNTKGQVFFQWSLQVSGTEGFVAWRQERLYLGALYCCKLTCGTNWPMWHYMQALAGKAMCIEMIIEIENYI